MNNRVTDRLYRVCIRCSAPITPGPNYATKKYCGRACYKVAITFTPEQRAEAFWSKVDKSAGPEACWPWQGAVTTHGYGCFQTGSKRVLGTHKVAYTLAKGDVPDGLQIMHACDNPVCCNPVHLSLGTHTDNARDRSRKGRTPKKMPRKLTYEKALEIRALRGKKSSGEIAKLYGIGQPYVFTIWAGRCWSRPKQRNGWETGARKRAASTATHETGGLK